MTETKDANNTRSLGRVTGALAALVALNTLVYSCSTEYQAKQADAIAQEESHETFWLNAMRDLDSLVRDRPAEATGVVHNNWLARCQILSQRTIQVYGNADDKSPDSAAGAYDDNKVPEYPRAIHVYNHTLTVKRLFIHNMGDSGLVGPDCANTFAVAQTKHDALAKAIVPDDNAAPEDPAIAAAFVGEDPSIRMNRAAINPQGYDIDVFWCDRPNTLDARPNVVAAATFARTLAVDADNGKQFKGQSLGKIRLRRLSIPAQQLEDVVDNRSPAKTGTDKQEFKHHPITGIIFKFDQNDQTERGMAEALAKQTGGIALGQAIRSNWYLSGFFCAAESTPPTTPQNTAKP